jgi:uncharacterized membrane protein
MKISGYWWLAAAILLLFWLMTAVAYPLLPERVPAHFGPDGQVTRWEYRSVVWQLPVVASLLMMMIFGLTRLAYRYHDQLNLPNKEQFLKLPAAARQQVMLRMDAHLAGLATVTLAVFSWIQWNVYQTATTASAGLAAGFWVFPVLLTAQVVWMLLDIGREVARQTQRTL